MTHHIDEVLESDGGGGVLLRPFQQDVSLVGVDFGDELRLIQNLQEVVPRYLAKSLRVVLPSTQDEPKIMYKKVWPSLSKRKRTLRRPEHRWALHEGHPVASNCRTH